MLTCGSSRSYRLYIAIVYIALWSHNLISCKSLVYRIICTVQQSWLWQNFIGHLRFKSYQLMNQFSNWVFKCKIWLNYSCSNWCPPLRPTSFWHRSTLRCFSLHTIQGKSIWYRALPVYHRLVQELQIAYNIAFITVDTDIRQNQWILIILYYKSNYRLYLNLCIFIRVLLRRLKTRPCYFIF